MKVNDRHVREPLFHITRRSGIIMWKAWLIRLIAILFSLAVCALILMKLTHYTPLEIYTRMIDGSFGTERKIMNLLQGVAMLLCISLAVTPAFKMKFWNLGAEGQVLIGGLASAACMFFAGNDIPGPLLILIMLLVSILSGMIWGVIPAVFKTFWGTNETLFTLMMNYVAMHIVGVCIAIWVPSGSNVMGIINLQTQNGWLPAIFEQKYLINILTVAVLTVLMFIYLRYSKQGYEISVVGESQNTARYVGINVKKVIIRTMLISGAICGLAGFLLVAGTSHTINKNLAGGMGFTAIMVSWLAKFNPITMILTAFLVVFLQRGSKEMVMVFRMDSSISDILVGIIILFIIGCEFFINYKINFAPRKTEETKWGAETVFISKRILSKCILYSILTLGLYSIYWKYLCIKNLQAIEKKEKNCVPEMLCWVFVPFYSLYWWVTRSHLLERQFSKHQYPCFKQSFIYLFLTLCGLELVSLAILQNDFNSLPSVNTEPLENETDADMILSKEVSQ